MPPQNQFSKVPPDHLLPKPRSHTFLLIIFILLLATGAFGVWYFLNPAPELIDESVPMVKDEFADWKTYRNEEFGFEFKYPEYLNYEEKNQKSFDGKGWLGIRMHYLNDARVNFAIEINAPAIGLWEGCKEDVISEEKIINGARFNREQYCGGENLVYEIDYKDNYFLIIDRNFDNTFFDQILSTFKFISTSTPVIAWDSENQVDFEGYYTQTKRSEWGSAVVCDSFVVTNSNYLVDYYKNMVRTGNTVNTINEEGYLVINLELSSLRNDVVEKIKNSNDSKQISIAVRKKIQEGKGAPECYSFFSIIE